MSSPDNPQFDPQLSLNTEPQNTVPGPGDPFAATSLPPASLAPQPGGPLPVENPVWNGWDVLLLALLTVVSIFVLQTAAVKIAQWIWFPRKSWFQVAQTISQTPMLVIVLQLLTYIPVAVLMVALVEGKYHVQFWQAVRWNWPNARLGLAAVALGGFTLVILSLAELALPMPKDTPFEHLFDRPLDAYLLAALAVTVGPLMEELFFRGLLYPVIARRLGAVWGVLLTALPFGLLHLQQYGWALAAGLIIFMVGIVCGIVRAVTHSVGSSFLVHVGYNGTQMLIAVVATHGFRHMERAFICLS